MSFAVSDRVSVVAVFVQEVDPFTIHDLVNVTLFPNVTLTQADAGKTLQSMELW